MDELLRNREKELTEALNYAISVIESYEMDIRNSEWTGVDLVAIGFCQGKIYQDAVPRLLEVLQNETETKANPHRFPM